MGEKKCLNFFIRRQVGKIVCKGTKCEVYCDDVFDYLGILEESDRQTTCVMLISAIQAESRAFYKIEKKNYYLI